MRCDTKTVIYIMTCDVRAKQDVLQTGETLRERMVKHRNRLHEHREKKMRHMLERGLNQESKWTVTPMRSNPDDDDERYQSVWPMLHSQTIDNLSQTVRQT